jgi:protein-tyrosine phosphatase
MSDYQTVENMMVEIPLNLAGKVYRSDMPWSFLYDERGELVDAYRRKGVSAVVVLSPEDEIRVNTGQDLVGIYRTEGWEVIHLPAKNLGVPDRESLARAVDTALDIARKGRSIAVHCHAGIGRTGMFLAVMAGMILGLKGPAAVSFVRDYVYGAVETIEQLDMVYDLLKNT